MWKFQEIFEKAKKTFLWKDDGEYNLLPNPENMENLNSFNPWEYIYNPLEDYCDSCASSTSSFSSSSSHAWIKCNNCSDYNATFYDTEEYDECPVCKKERDKIEIEFLSDEDMKL
jgi:hypothetical protein